MMNDEFQTLAPGVCVDFCCALTGPTDKCVIYGRTDYDCLVVRRVAARQIKDKTTTPKTLQCMSDRQDCGVKTDLHTMS